MHLLARRRPIRAVDPVKAEAVRPHVAGAGAPRRPNAQLRQGDLGGARHRDDVVGARRGLKGQEGPHDHGHLDGGGGRDLLDAAAEWVLARPAAGVRLGGVECGWGYGLW